MRLLRELTEAHSVPGHEDEVRAVFVRELAEAGELGGDRCDLLSREAARGFLESELLVGEMLHQFHQLRVPAEKMFADVYLKS